MCARDGWRRKARSSDHLRKSPAKPRVWSQRCPSPRGRRPSFLPTLECRQFCLTGQYLACRTGSADKMTPSVRICVLAADPLVGVRGGKQSQVLKLDREALGPSPGRPRGRNHSWHNKSLVGGLPYSLTPPSTLPSSEPRRKREGGILALSYHAPATLRARGWIAFLLVNRFKQPTSLIRLLRASNRKINGVSSTVWYSLIVRTGPTPSSRSRVTLTVAKRF